MEADKILSLFHDPKQIERLKVCLHDIFEYPVVITGVLRKVEKFLTEDIRLREQHRVLSQKLKETCMKVLEYINLTESHSNTSI